MKHTAALLLALTMALTAASFGAGAQSVTAPAKPAKPAPAASAAMTLDFAGTAYLHRWSNNHQHEFTPRDDADLARWKDMLTLNVHPAARSGEDLARVANQVVGHYQKAGKILRTQSRPRSADQPAEHFVAAVLGHPAYLEAAFARFRLHDGAGVVLVYSHRIYGKSGPEMGAWLEANGDRVEKALMAWESLPALDALRRLPQK